ncbi:hypothetical protein BH09SUM1_BH09SUM1_16860 [soil metagenome]
MTIARRLIVLLAAPLLILVVIGIISHQQMARVEDRTRFVAESRLEALARLGDISRNFADMRLNVRDYLLATDDTGRSAVRAKYDAGQTELTRLLDDYSDRWTTSEQGRRYGAEFRTLSVEWEKRSEEAMSPLNGGNAATGYAALPIPVMDLGDQIGKVETDWIRYNEDLATTAGKDAVASIESSRMNLMLAIILSMTLSGILGLLTFRRIINPIQALQISVDAIASGDYAREAPFTDAKDEIGSLARSVEILKRGGAAAEELRKVKSSAAILTLQLQSATGLAEFGKRLISGLVPELGGGVAAFYSLAANPERLQRVASYGLASDAEAADSFKIGEGLVGECARERKPLTIDTLNAGYASIA